MSNEQVKARIEAGANQKYYRHPNKRRTTQHPVSGKCGVQSRG